MTDQDALSRILVSQAEISASIKGIKEDVKRLVHAVDGNDSTPGLKVEVDRMNHRVQQVVEDCQCIQKRNSASRVWMLHTILAGIVIVLIAEIFPVVEAIFRLMSRDGAVP